MGFVFAIITISCIPDGLLIDTQRLIGYDTKLFTRDTYGSRAVWALCPEIRRKSAPLCSLALGTFPRKLQELVQKVDA